MADINENYIMLYTLQQYFVDKITGEPLANGKIYFYKDDDRNVLKDVYKYDSVNGYTALSNPVTLSAVGTPLDDDNNDIAIYAFPYTDEFATDLELYYVVVKSYAGVTQSIRESIPNLTSDPDVQNDRLTNYIPNGQFLLHNNIPLTDTTPAGKITQPITTVAPGGWTWERHVSSTSTDNITFSRYSAYTPNPNGNPRYAITILTTGDDHAPRGLRIKFPDVNKFAGAEDFTFVFFGKSIGSDLANVPINLIRNFGTGGSPSPEESINQDTVTITTTGTMINCTIHFDTTATKTLGTNDDDYLQIEIQIPSSASANITLTDFILTPGDVQIEEFPNTSNAKFIADSLAGWTKIPDYDGDDMYLPLVLTPSGLTFSRADIGKINAAIYETAKIGELLCDGSQYEATAYSSDGIPYSRLFDDLYLSDAKVPKYGTGLNFATTYIESVNTNRMLLCTNQFNTASAPIAATSGFTVTQIHTADGTDRNIRAVQYLSNGLYIIDKQIGPRTAPTVNTSGYTISVLRNLDASFHIFSIQTTATSGYPSSGDSAYFSFTTSGGNFFIWFQRGTSVVPAAATGTGIEVKIQGDESDIDMALILKHVLIGCQVYSIQTIAASAPITGGNYFTFGTTGSNEYYVWYKKDNIGTSPGINGKIGIEVDILSSDTAVEVADKTRVAINSKYYAVPDFRGQILRGYDPDLSWDIDAAIRWSMVGGVYGNRLGTFQLDQLLSHNHPGSFLRYFTGGSAPQSVQLRDFNTGEEHITNDFVIALEGGGENRVVNTNVNYFIKY